ncbi:hypothetical protein IJG96_03040 [Candidatus Saccharibacteria bacterium]|nr:hypothetical protein [Candidatus Saccharibacteria bacterium]
MLAKLFKLEFKWVNKFVPLFLGAALILGIASRLTTDLSSVAGLVIHNTLQSLAISATVGLICNVLARSIVHFKNSLIKDESYLLRTLPVEPKDLWNARVLTFISSMFLALVATLGVLALLFMNAELWTTIKTLVSDHSLAFIFLILTVLTEVTVLGLSVFSSTLLGRRAKGNRNLKTGLYAILFYFGAQILLLGLAFVLSQLFPSFNNIFSATDDMPFLDVIKNFQFFFVLATAFYTLVSIVLYLLGKRTLEKGVDVE